MKPLTEADALEAVREGYWPCCEEHELEHAKIFLRAFQLDPSDIHVRTIHDSVLNLRDLLHKHDSQMDAWEDPAWNETGVVCRSHVMYLYNQEVARAKDS